VDGPAAQERFAIDWINASPECGPVPSQFGRTAGVIARLPTGKTKLGAPMSVITKARTGTVLLTGALRDTRQIRALNRLAPAPSMRSFRKRRLRVEQQFSSRLRNRAALA
jgi:hypothetical protein